MARKHGLEKLWEFCVRNMPGLLYTILPNLDQRRHQIFMIFAGSEMDYGHRTLERTIGKEIATEQLKRFVMDVETVPTGREAYYISEATLASSKIKNEDVKRAIVEEVNMVVDIMFYFMSGPWLCRSARSIIRSYETKNAYVDVNADSCIVMYVRQKMQ